VVSPLSIVGIFKVSLINYAESRLPVLIKSGNGDTINRMMVDDASFLAMKRKINNVFHYLLGEFNNECERENLSI